MKKIVGYTAGVYDMFHVGHLNLLRRAKDYCDYLIVGVNSDDLTFSYKNKHPVIPQDDRIEIIKSIKYVDEVFLAEDVVRVDEGGLLDVYERFKPDLIIIGDDHESDPRWQEVGKYLRSKGSMVKYLPYTNHVSSTKLTGRNEHRIED